MFLCLLQRERERERERGRSTLTSLTVHGDGMKHVSGSRRQVSVLYVNTHLRVARSRTTPMTNERSVFLFPYRRLRLTQLHGDASVFPSLRVGRGENMLTVITTFYNRRCRRRRQGILLFRESLRDSVKSR